MYLFPSPSAYLACSSLLETLFSNKSGGTAQLFVFVTGFDGSGLKLAFCPCSGALLSH